jgi:hypothetical protein
MNVCPCWSSRCMWTGGHEAEDAFRDCERAKELLPRHGGWRVIIGLLIHIGVPGIQGLSSLDFFFSMAGQD